MYLFNQHNNSLFCKCIHLKDEVGIFASYYKDINKEIPRLLIKEYKNNYFSNYLGISPSVITLNNQNLERYILLNDIVKMNENKVIFMSTVENREKLYIALINFFGTNYINLDITLYQHLNYIIIKYYLN